MIKKLLGVSLVGIFAFASSHANWGYKGEIGPNHWGDLDEKFIMCKIGKNQSPIDIKNSVVASIKALNVDYKTYTKYVLNNGHTIKVVVPKGNTLKMDGKTFKLLQFHFHTPSENAIDGKLYPMEMHLVHQADDGSLAVIGVMFKIGKYNPDLEKIIKTMPVEKGEKFKLNNLYISNLLPKDLSYYRFNGSLTTPPCSEGVRWYVLKTPIEMSKAQWEKFHKVMGKNNRPLQPIYARKILE